MDIFIVEGVRTPFCKAGSALDQVPAVELGRVVLRELWERAEIEPLAIDAVVAGNVVGPMDAVNVARVIALEAGLPDSVPALTVGRNCASGMEAVIDAGRRIAAGEAELVAALGVESMSRVPLVFPDEFRRLLGRAARARSWWARLAVWSQLRPRHLKPVVALLQGLTDPVSGLNMGETAELLAREFGIGRGEQDGYSLRSHQRAIAARREGRLGGEVVPLFVGPKGDRPVAEDIGPREGLTLEQLGRLRPVFERSGTVTAGNSSMITDGAAGMLVASAAKVRDLGLKPLARLRAHATVGLDPRRMGLGPAYAIPRVLKSAGLELGHIGLVEINEAFAVQVLACQAALDSEQFARDELAASGKVGTIDPDRLNVNGGAIALGHPVGASGARLILTLAREMGRRRVQFGLASLCVGGGQGQAVVLESVS